MADANTDYALLAGNVYRSTRSDINQIPIPSAWIELPGTHQNLNSGFEAGVYSNGSEIVIAFAGTYQPAGLFGFLNADNVANLNLFLGALSSQLTSAAALYESIKKGMADGTVENLPIRFVGHSLGGGLAALMGVFFNQPATTFNPAPFRSAATELNRDLIKRYLAQRGFNDPDLNSFTSSQTFFVPPNFIVPFRIRGEEKITAIATQGEFLTTFPLSDQLRIKDGPTRVLEHGSPNTVDGTNLHAIALAESFLQNDQFRLVTKKLPNVLPFIFDDKLFSARTETRTPDFVTHVVRHETDRQINPRLLARCSMKPSFFRYPAPARRRTMPLMSRHGPL